LTLTSGRRVGWPFLKNEDGGLMSEKPMRHGWRLDDGLLASSIWAAVGFEPPPSPFRFCWRLGVPGTEPRLPLPKEFKRPRFWAGVFGSGFLLGPATTVERIYIYRTEIYNNHSPIGSHIQYHGLDRNDSTKYRSFTVIVTSTVASCGDNCRGSLGTAASWTFDALDSLARIDLQ
jgi:hypothetical protein